MARYLAIDWDKNELHIVSADIRGTDVQVRRAALSAETQAPTLENAEAMGKLLAERLKSAGIGGAPVLCCIGRDRFIVKEICFPRVPELEEPAVVRFQTIKELTDSPDDVVIDYLTVSSPPEGEQKALALVIRREVLQTYRTLCESAGLKLAALTPRLVGTSACLRAVMGTTVVTPAPDPVDGTIAVVILGDKQAELSILKGKVPLLARSMTNASNLAADIRRNLAVHAGQSPQFPVCAVYLAGKGATELRERLAELIEIPVHTFDPFAGSESPHLPTGNRGSFAPAMGLLHVKAAGQMPINFVAPRQPRPASNPNYRLLRLALVASVTLVLGLVVLGRVVYASRSEELTDVRASRDKVDAEKVKTAENHKRLKLINDWDTIVWEDELYDLTARMGDVNALRLTSIVAESIVPNAKTKTKAAGKITIKGRLLNRSNPRKPLDQFVSRFSKDGYYSPDAPKVENDKFTLVVYVDRRGPIDYQYLIKDAEKSKTSKSKDSSKSKSKTKNKSDR